VLLLETAAVESERCTTCSSSVVTSRAGGRQSRRLPVAMAPGHDSRAADVDHQRLLGTGGGGGTWAGWRVAAAVVARAGEQWRWRRFFVRALKRLCCVKCGRPGAHSVF
jgi:hypothetical protein